VPVDPGEQIAVRLRNRGAVRSVRLVGSRARGDAVEVSDWDLAVEADDASAVTDSLQNLLADLRPLALVPDPLADRIVVAVLLPGPVKVDLIFEQRHEIEPPWEVSAETLDRIDAHFWDWMLWLASKQVKGLDQYVSQELSKLHAYILSPLGMPQPPSSIGNAISEYCRLMDAWSDRLKMPVRRDLRATVVDFLQERGVIGAAT
jgi:predicted nucleotidyltransferase